MWRQLPDDRLDPISLEPVNTLEREPVELIAGVSLSTLKRACRRLGIKRWPARQLLAVRRKQTLIDIQCTTRTAALDEPGDPTLPEEYADMLHDPTLSEEYADDRADDRASFAHLH